MGCVFLLQVGGSRGRRPAVTHGNCRTRPAPAVNAYGVTVDVTDAIRRYGAAKVDTTSATPLDAPYGFAVLYTVEDVAGNAAVPAWRLVRVMEQSKILLSSLWGQNGCGYRPPLAGSGFLWD